MGGGRYLNEFAVDLDVAGIGQLEAGEDLHERGFAGAIFSHHRVDAASFYHEFCAVVGWMPEAGSASRFHASGLQAWAAFYSEGTWKVS